MEQKLTKRHKSSFQIARSYYGIICKFNSIPVSDTELSLLAFTAINGNISKKEEFSKQFGFTVNYVNNLIGNLQKLNLFKKINKKIVVNPSILLDFSNNITLKIDLVNGVIPEGHITDKNS